MQTPRLFPLAGLAFTLALALVPAAAMAGDDGIAVDRGKYAGRQTEADFTASDCPDNPRSLQQVKDNLYRHTTGAGLAVHSGLVLITKEGALVIDPAMTCTSTWLRDEIRRRFKVPVKYVVLSHAHFDHAAGAQVFQQDGAIVVANQRALEPIIGEKLPTALPDRVFDKQMTITLGGETVELHRIAPSHSDSMTMVLFPRHHVLQCTDVCESKSMPYNDFLDFYYPGWIETLDWVLAQDVDIIDIGHYSPGTKQDIAAERAYMVDLHQQVLDLTRQGMSWDHLYRNVKFSPDIKNWIGYDTMKTLNILGMYRWVSNHRRGVW